MKSLRVVFKLWFVFLFVLGVGSVSLVLSSSANVYDLSVILVKQGMYISEKIS